MKTYLATKDSRLEEERMLRYSLQTPDYATPGVMLICDLHLSNKDQMSVIQPSSKSTLPHDLKSEDQIT